MPLRVKCRCGQELVLRYGDWVYFSLGLLLLCLVVNSTVLVLLYFRLEEVSGSVRGRAPAPRESSEVERRGKVEGEPLPPLSGARSEAEGGPPPPPLDGKGGGVPARPRAIRNSPAAPGSGPGVEKESNPQGASAPPSKPQQAVAAEGAISPGLAERPLTSPSLLDGAAFEESVRSGEKRLATPARGSTGGAAVLPPVLSEPALIRFFLLEEGRAGALLPLALLADPDPLLRRRALERALSQPPPAADSAEREAARVLLLAAPYLEADERRGKLFTALGIEPSAASPPPWKENIEPAPALAEMHQALRLKVKSSLEVPALRLLHDRARKLESAELDLVLAVDVSRSMEGALESIHKESLWLLPALFWLIPQLRVGLILYRDQVEAASGFSTRPADLLALLRETRAEGGGDVPEGVHQALKTALLLGRFNWRKSAEKHVVLLGDAPPPFAEVEGLRSLVALATEQGGYQLHALSVRPEEGRSAVPFFPDLARAGRGRAAAIQRVEDAGLEVLLCIFPLEAQGVFLEVAAALRALFL